VWWRYSIWYCSSCIYNTATSWSGPGALAFGFVATIAGGCVGYNTMDVVANKIDED